MTWTLYADKQPETAGVYKWRVPNKAIGANVIFLAHMRERGAGYRKVISPAFDHWDGYRVTVPAGTEWQRIETPPDIKHHEQPLQEIESLTSEPCPFCKKAPAWHGVRRSGDGLIVTSNQHEFNSWWLACCMYANTPHVNDPRALCEKRNALIREHRGTS